MPQLTLSVQESMPRDGHALLVGRAWLPSDDGPAVIGVRGAEAVNLTRAYPTASHLLNVAKPEEISSAIRRAPRWVASTRWLPTASRVRATARSRGSSRRAISRP